MPFYVLRIPQHHTRLYRLHVRRTCIVLVQSHTHNTNTHSPYTQIREKERKRKSRLSQAHNIVLCSSNTLRRMHCSTHTWKRTNCIRNRMDKHKSVLFSSHLCYCFCVYHVCTNVYSAFCSENRVGKPASQPAINDNKSENSSSTPINEMLPFLRSNTT